MRFGHTTHTLGSTRSGTREALPVKAGVLTLEAAASSRSARRGTGASGRTARSCALRTRRAAFVRAGQWRSTDHPHENPRRSTNASSNVRLRAHSRTRPRCPPPSASSPDCRLPRASRRILSIKRARVPARPGFVDRWMRRHPNSAPSTTSQSVADSSRNISCRASETLAESNVKRSRVPRALHRINTSE